jgi:acetyl-CoA carboxylase beta subunit
MEIKEKIDFYNNLVELIEIKARLRGDHLQSEGVLKQLDQLTNLFDPEEYKNYKKEPELGKAGIRLELEDSVITMSHGESGRLLFKFTATSGDWSSICQFIRSLGNKKEDE